MQEAIAKELYYYQNTPEEAQWCVVWGDRVYPFGAGDYWKARAEEHTVDIPAGNRQGFTFGSLIHYRELPTPNCPGCLGTGNHSLDCYGGWGPNFEQRCEEGSGLDLATGQRLHPACRSILEPTETKSDPETERIVAVALAAFWRAIPAAGRGSGSPVSADTRLRLEIAAYDAVEEWRAENPVEPIQVRTPPLRG